jgi:hypothetical protein
MTEEQEALLEEAVKCAHLVEQDARELYEWGDAFAAKWEKRLHNAEASAKLSNIDRQK